MIGIVMMIFDLVKGVLRWHTEKVGPGWRRELRRVVSGENRWSRSFRNKWVYVLVCVVFSGGLFFYFVGEAFAVNILLGLSFVVAAFPAFCFGLILRHPMMMVLIYLAAVLGSEISGLFSVAGGEFSAGNYISAAVLVGLAIYLYTEANKIGSGDILATPKPRRKLKRRR